MAMILGGDWMGRAACRSLSDTSVATVAALTGQHDTAPAEVIANVFFPNRTTANQHASSPAGRIAAQLCDQCPVAPYCLAAAVHRCEKYGTWGGLTDRDRRELRHNLTVRGVVYRFDICQQCFQPFPLEGKRAWGRYCSDDCYRAVPHLQGGKKGRRATRDHRPGNNRRKASHDGAAA